METKCCSRCSVTKDFDKFVINKNFCKECKNLRYVQLRSEKNQIKLEEIEKEIGKDNKKCIYCDGVFDKSYFKYKKCLDCKRKCDSEYNKNESVKTRKRIKRQTDIVCKFKHLQSSRIRNSLNFKSKKTIEYLGCNTEQYFNWLKFNFIDTFCFENHAEEWHIDHVIPLSHFNLENEEHQLIAFNWRNTTPLSVKENLSKNNKIIKSQIEQHLKKLKEYHIENKLDLPQEFIDLFATRPNCVKPLRAFTTTHTWKHM
jgi:hypothetical protein